MSLYKHLSRTLLPLLLLATLLSAPARAQEPSKPLVDTAAINALRDTIRWKLTQLLDIDMLSACLQVRKLENVHGLSLLGPNVPLRDTVAAFEKGYQTRILVHSFVSSNQFWPRALFNPRRLDTDMGKPHELPAVGFGVSFTPQGVGANRQFAVSVRSTSTPGLLTTDQEGQLQGATRRGLTAPFPKVKPATDSVNAALFRGIAQLRGFWQQAQDQCNIRRVTFAQAPDASFGFSALPHEQLAEGYPTITVRGGEYRIPWVSVAAGATERVTARVALLAGDTASHAVRFRTASGAPLAPTLNPDSTLTLTLPGGSPGSTESVQAFVTDTVPGGRTQDIILGELRVATYAPVRQTVIPVRLNGAPCPPWDAIAQELNSRYRQAALTWDVKEPLELTLSERDWDVEGEPDGKLLIATSMFNRYSAEMRAVTQAVERLSGYDPEAYYVIVTRIPNTLGYDGYMPLKSQFAFVFATSADKQPRIMAHELGHGAFYLRHPQDEYQILGSTGNLMDRFAIGTDLWKSQWDWVADPSFRIYAFQDEEDGAAFRQSGTKFLCINDEKALAELSEFQILYLPDGKKANLQGKYIASGFYLADDVTESAQGAIYSLRINGFDNYQIYNQKHETTAFGYRISDESAVRSISADALKAEDDAIAYRVFIDKKNDNTGKILVKSDNELVRTIDFTGDCKCSYPPSADDIYFKTSSISKVYIDYYQKRSLKIDQAIYQNEELVNQLVQEISQQQENGFDENVFGKVLADKLKTYEKVNNRKFYVAFYQTNILCLHQSSWNRLADEVFLKANLPSDAILITLPYVQCSGIGSDLGEYFFMPGLSYGSNVTIDLSGLSKDYKNTQRTANFIADNSYSPVWNFVRDVFKNTAKQYVRHYFYITARGEIIGRSETESAYIGFLGNVDFRLVVDERIKKYFDLLDKTNETMDPKKLSSANPYEVNSHFKARQDAENEFNNFFTDNPSPKDFIVDHGMNEFVGTTDENNCIQFTEWYRDRIYAIDKKQASPSGDCFYAGRNEVDYNEALASIDALGLILMPFNFDWVADGIGFIYSGFHFDFINSSIYGTGAFIPLVSAGTIKSSSKALIRGLRTGDSRIIREGSEYVIKWVRNDFGDLDKLLRRLNSPNLADAFKKDFDNFAEATKKMFLEKPELVESWKRLHELGETALKTDVNALKTAKSLLDIDADLVTKELVTAGKKLHDNDLLKLVPNLSDANAAAVHQYTVNSMTLNRKLNQGSTLSSFETKWRNQIKEGLSQLRSTKKYTGRVVRGQSLPEDLIQSKYVQPFQKAKSTGGPALVEEKAFLSTSKDPSIADDFIMKSKSWPGSGDNPVLFRIDSKNGVDIDDISDYGNKLCSGNPKCTKIQQEVLLEDGTFRINDIKVTNQNGVNFYEIFLEEL